MSELNDKVNKAIKSLRFFEHTAGEDGFYVCYSGGKDSDTIRVLCELAGVKHELHHNLTTADAPETVRHVRSIPGIIIHYPKFTMWQLIAIKGFPPTRMTRYCCEYLKEHGGEGRFKVMGVRKAESPRRAERYEHISISGKRADQIADSLSDLNCAYRVTKEGIVMHVDGGESRQEFEQCFAHLDNIHVSLNPIVDWNDEEVWNFLRYYKVTVNPLYEQGTCRVGCIGCPLAGYKQMKREFVRFPKYRQMYVKAFDRMIEESKRNGKFRGGTWQTGEDVMRWWCGDDPRQITLSDYDVMELSAVREEDLISKA